MDRCRVDVVVLMHREHNCDFMCPSWSGKKQCLCLKTSWDWVVHCVSSEYQIVISLTLEL